MIGVARLHQLEELLARFGKNCSPTLEENSAIDTLISGIYRRLNRARLAGRMPK